MILLDGIPLRKWGIEIQREHDHPAIPEIRRKTMTIPGMPGEWDFGSELGQRSFTFPLGFIEYDQYKKQRRLNDFVAFLFDSNGRPRELNLTFDYEPDKYYQVKIANGFTPQRIFGFSFFELTLLASNPNKNFILPSSQIKMGSKIPIMSHIKWGTGSSNRIITFPETIKVINNGTISIPFSFRLEGRGNNVSISANGKTMTLGSFLNKVFEVTDNYIVKVDGINDLTSTNGVFLDLLPGVNEIHVDGTNLDLKISEDLIYQYI
ncbi:phage tail domain-containing protein [Cytobacillus horneckiae]|uniref:phage tail domain-containing protein n=1 Tax=Cytobacillus horneckiae TaxID=549687 RepID=UPI0039A30F85